MLFKIALNNVKKSYKDYAIYFLTLTLAVCVFYAFNSIDSQTVMGELSVAQRSYIKVFETITSIISVFIAFIFAALIVYANNFLIKKRKKELGIYMTLGMAKKRISLILVLETFIIGLFSLVIGLLIGLTFSQGLSVLTAKLFEIAVEKYSFVISTKAIIKTILYFGVMFIVIMLFNSFIVAKYKLIDLIYGGRKNEKIKIKNPIISLIIFIISIIILGYAYYRVNNSDPMAIHMMNDIIFPTILGAIGTFMFFFGLSGFFISVMKKRKSYYNKGLNSFVVKQMNNKINTNFISMAVISLMLFITITALATSLGFKKTSDELVEKAIPFDATIEVNLNIPEENHIYLNGEETSLDYFLKKANVEIPKEDKTVKFKTYYVNYDEFNFTDILKGKVSDEKLKTIDAMPMFMGIDDYNAIRKFEEKEAIDLKDDEILILSNNKELEKAYEDLIATKEKFKIKDRDYIISDYGVIKDNYNNIWNLEINPMLVVPENLKNNLTPIKELMNISFNDPKVSESLFNDLAFKKFYLDENDENSYFYIHSITKITTKENMQGMSTLILYVGMYLGIVFLLTSTAVLSLQQLSEASDSVERYSSLKKIGVSQGMINGAIFKQILIYFLAPLVLALVDSVFGISFVNNYLLGNGKSTILEPTLLTLGFLLVIYGGYFMATYIAYKNTILSKTK